MKITVEMEAFQYEEMVRNKVKAEKYDKFVAELRPITSYPEIHPMSFVQESMVHYSPYINIRNEELHKLVLSWNKDFMKKKTIKPKLDKKTGEYFIKMKHFKDYVDDVTLIDSYKLEPVNDLDNGICLLLSFYDKDGNLIEAKEEPENEY